MLLLLLLPSNDTPHLTLNIPLCPVNTSSTVQKKEHRDQRISDVSKNFFGVNSFVKNLLWIWKQDSPFSLFLSFVMECSTQGKDGKGFQRKRKKERKKYHWQQSQVVFESGWRSVEKKSHQSSLPLFSSYPVVREWTSTGQRKKEREGDGKKEVKDFVDSLSLLFPSCCLFKAHASRHSVTFFICKTIHQWVNVFPPPEDSRLPSLKEFWC